MEQNFPGLRKTNCSLKADFMATLKNNLLKLISFASEHKKKIDFAENMIANIARMIPATKTNYLYLAGGIISASNEFIRSVHYSANDFIKIKQFGTIHLSYHLASFAKEVFVNHSKTINFATEDQILVYNTEIGEIYLLKNRYNVNTIFFNKKTTSEEQIINYIVSEKMKKITEKFILLKYDNDNYLIVKNLYPQIFNSELSEQLFKRIETFNKKDIHRSILLKGSPGTGKTSLSYSVLQKLDYTTLVFSASNNLLRYELFLELLDLLKIDAIIIDDFDQYEQSNKNLDMIELFNKRCKVVIGIVNSVKDIHPALLRPGRFDEILVVEQLDDKVIRNALGPIYDQCIDAVRKWPIAYIQELSKRHQAFPEDDLSNHIADLSNRLYKPTETSSSDEVNATPIVVEYSK